MQEGGCSESEEVASRDQVLGSSVMSALTQAEVDCQSAIKPQVSLELFSVPLDAPCSIIALKALIQVQEFVCHHTEAGRGSAMVAPLLSQSH